MPIRQLSPEIVNRIAAGEVIERPASVVKELVENALDAGATQIDVVVEDGGRRLISVRDNGGGMDAEDLALAFVPHATSKISGEDDLFNIRTMGFRGEALASVASVSHAHILTRPRGSADGAGYEIRADGDTLGEVRPAASAEGTTITIRDLFYNTPARRKFLRTADTEFGHVVEQLARLALPNAAAGFTLTHNGRPVQRLLAGQSLRQRLTELYGAELGESLIEFAGRDRAVEVRGLLGPPAAARATARFQYFFVNGRYVHDRFLAHALREAYRGLVDPSRCPLAFVFIRMDPGELDVNVHPTKIEVRFRNGQFVHSQVFGTIREALNRPDMVPAAEIAAGGPPLEPDQDQRRQSLKQALADFFKSNPPPQRRLDFPTAAVPTYVGTPPRAEAGVPKRESSPLGSPPVGRFLSQPRPASRPAPLPVSAADSAAPRPQPTATPATGEGVPKPLSSGLGAPYAPHRPALAMQVHDSYIVTATENGLAIIDQHALHERILFQELLDRVAGGHLASQRMLIPQTLEVTESDKAAVAEQAALLERLGIELTEFGPRSLAVQRFPSMLAARGVPVPEFLRDLLDLLGERGGVPKRDSSRLGTPAADSEELLSKVLSSMACQAAVKAGQVLSSEEMESLLAQRETVERSTHCPHGRPTSLTLTLEELEKQFKRA